ncbi:hypothetical protein COCC4DRAFT_147690 [Bipolaris maydis ATCC 48331]|uniref:Uncharacterized protein n=2 Tax=Cochliobolus heterostrophus TaxID=5016 RepID=M2U7Y5_COCH5|nr:uncharacterized protein COCC4DRAFT_147690 [Bipolaris maydis ATCC 48331]EMD94649.1 hypothetical protein COCHEDRAFT_1152526 [Bipolaris maydis C5]ENI01639.1 hypothetical protein COCC4DRAFT_147690 [Bipolaris maydis ATCC 48331]
MSHSAELGEDWGEAKLDHNAVLGNVQTTSFGDQYAQRTWLTTPRIFQHMHARHFSHHVCIVRLDGLQYRS